MLQKGGFVVCFFFWFGKEVGLVVSGFCDFLGGSLAMSWV